MLGGNIEKSAAVLRRSAVAQAEGAVSSVLPRLPGFVTGRGGRCGIAGKERPSDLTSHAVARLLSVSLSAVVAWIDRGYYFLDCDRDVRDTPSRRATHLCHRTNSTPKYPVRTPPKRSCDVRFVLTAIRSDAVRITTQGHRFANCARDVAL